MNPLEISEFLPLDAALGPSADLMDDRYQQVHEPVHDLTLSTKKPTRQ